jgi:hypothetical protein
VEWKEAKTRYDHSKFIHDGWRLRLKQESGYMARPKIIKINPDKKKKRIMAKHLALSGWSTKQIAIWFKTTPHNVLHWTKMATPESMMEFEKNFVLALKEENMKGMAMVTSRLMEIIPQEENIEKLVKAGEFFRGPKQEKPNSMTQVNVYSDLVKKYTPQGITEEYGSK